MRTQAPFKVHLRCLKSIYTHILLRSPLYELLMNSTFCYPPFLIHRGKEKQTRKPMQAAGKQMHRSILHRKGQGGFRSRRAARHLCEEEKGNKRNKKLVLRPRSCLSNRSCSWDFTSTSLTQQEAAGHELLHRFCRTRVLQSHSRCLGRGHWVALSSALKPSWQPQVSLAQGLKENPRKI